MGELSGSILHLGKGDGYPRIYMYGFFELYTKFMNFTVCKLDLHRAVLIWFDLSILIKYMPIQVFNSFLLIFFLPFLPIFHLFLHVFFFFKIFLSPVIYNCLCQSYPWLQPLCLDISSSTDLTILFNSLTCITENIVSKLKF